MQLQVHNLNKGQFTLEFDKNDTIKDIKNKIRARENLPISQLSLLHEGMSLTESLLGFNSRPDKFFNPISCFGYPGKIPDS